MNYKIINNDLPEDQDDSKDDEPKGMTPKEWTIIRIIIVIVIIVLLALAGYHMFY